MDICGLNWLWLSLIRPFGLNLSWTYVVLDDCGYHCLDTLAVVLTDCGYHPLVYLLTKTLNYLTFQSSDYECTWWRLFHNRLVQFPGLRDTCCSISRTEGYLLFNVHDWWIPIVQCASLGIAVVWYTYFVFYILKTSWTLQRKTQKKYFLKKWMNWLQFLNE